MDGFGSASDDHDGSSPAIGGSAAEPTADFGDATGQPMAQPSQAQTNLAPPTTMDQVVDRVILREKDLIKFLSPRTPIVETYLQNLTQDPHWARFRRMTITSSAAWT